MKNNTRIFQALAAVCVFIFIWGCAPKKSLEPVAPDVIGQEDIKGETDLLSILLTEAQNFVDQGNYSDALLIYNQALTQAGPDRKDEILGALELLMMQTPPQVLSQFAQIKNLSIPMPLLQYYAGLNYAAAGDRESAIAALGEFVLLNPDHEYFADANNLLESLDQKAFDKDIVGCILPLSGKYEIYGTKALKGIQMAVQDMSEKLGRPLRVVVKDSKSDPDHAAVCVEELARENVMAIVGPLLSPGAAGQMAQTLQIPMIAMTQNPEFPLSGEYLFSNFITPQMQVQALGSYIFKDLGLKKVAIFYPDEGYGKLYRDLFWDVVDSFHGEIVGVEAYDGTKTDFATPLQKLTGAFYTVPDEIQRQLEQDLGGTEDATDGQDRPRLSSRGSAVANEDRLDVDFDALFIPDALSRVNLILPQLAFNDVRNVVLMGTNLWHNSSLITQARGYNQNAVIPDGYFGSSQNPVTADFHARFTGIFQEEPGFLEAIAYDSVKILFTAAMADAVDSRRALKEMLQGNQLFEGVTGRTIFDENGIPRKELFLLTVRQGKFMEILR